MKNIIISIVVGVIVVAGAVAWLKLNSQKQLSQRVVGPCEVELEPLVMSDAMMRGIYEPGEELILEKGYYACNSVARGETVLYQFSAGIPAVVKRVVAVEGNQFEVIKDEKGRGWNLEVNSDLVSTPEGEVYYFGGQTPPPLSLYVEPRNGILGKGEVILFSARPPGKDDSGRTGLVSTSDILGRVVKKVKDN